MKREHKRQLLKKMSELERQFNDMLASIVRESSSSVQNMEPPVWLVNVLAELLKVIFPKIKNTRELIGNPCVDEPSAIGNFHGSFKYAADSLRSVKKQVSPKFAKVDKFTRLLAPIAEGLSQLFALAIEKNNWLMQQRKIYHRHFADVYCAGRGETQYWRLHMFLLMYYPLVVKCKNVTQLHKICVGAKFYAADIDSFRRLCSRLGIKLAPRGRTNATVSPPSPS